MQIDATMCPLVALTSDSQIIDTRTLSRLSIKFKDLNPSLYHFSFFHFYTIMNLAKSSLAVQRTGVTGATIWCKPRTNFLFLKKKNRTLIKYDRVIQHSVPLDRLTLTY